jgi:signal peptidase I
MSGKHPLRDLVIVFLVVIVLAVFLKSFVVDALRISSPSMESTLEVGDYIFINKLVYGTGLLKYYNFSSFLHSLFDIRVLRPISRGDIVAFKSPDVDKTNEYFVKRSIGLPGDTVEIRDGAVCVNGKDFALPDEREWSTPTDFGPVVVPRKGDDVRLEPGMFKYFKNIIRSEGHSVEMKDSSFFIDGLEKATYTVKGSYLFVLGDNLGNSYDSRSWGFLPQDKIIGRALLVYWSVDANYPKHGLAGFLSSIRWKRIGTVVR